MNKTSSATLNSLDDAERTSGKCGYRFGSCICNRPAGHPGKHIERATVTVAPETNLDLIQIERND